MYTKIYLKSSLVIQKTMFWYLLSFKKKSILTYCDLSDLVKVCVYSFAHYREVLEHPSPLYVRPSGTTLKGSGYNKIDHLKNHLTIITMGRIDIKACTFKIMLTAQKYTFKKNLDQRKNPKVAGFFVFSQLLFSYF